MDTENGAIPFATASHPGYPFTFKRRESLPGAPERLLPVYIRMEESGPSAPESADGDPKELVEQV